MAVNNVVTISDGLATNADICRLFNLTDKTVRKKLTTVQPAMKKGISVFYKLEDVLPLLVKPKNVEEYIKSMSFLELDKTLTKEYWAGQRSKQIFEREAGQLWSTDEVLEKVGTSFKTITMEIKLMADNVRRTTGFTDDQRQLLEDLIDGTLRGIQTKLSTTFAQKEKIVLPEEPGKMTPMIEVDEDDDEL